MYMGIATDISRGNIFFIEQRLQALFLQGCDSHRVEEQI